MLDLSMFEDGSILASHEARQLFKKFKANLRREGKREGKLEGRLEGKLEGVLDALEARGLAPGDPRLEVVRASRDAEALTRVLRALVRGAAVDEAIAELGPRS